VNNDRENIRDTDLRDNEMRDRNVTGKNLPHHATRTMVRPKSEHGEIDQGERTRPETGAGE
jgi:hypothetical protein